MIQVLSKNYLKFHEAASEKNKLIQITPNDGVHHYYYFFTLNNMFQLYILKNIVYYTQLLIGKKISGVI